MAAEKERELAGLTSVSDANRNAAGTGSRSAKPEKSESRVRSWIARHVYPQSLIDIRSPVFWKDVVLESIVSAYVLCLVLFVMVTCNKEHYRPTTTHFGLFAAFLIYVLIDGWGPLCGTLLNPAAVFGFFLAGRMSLVRCVMFMGAETAGAAAGAMIGYSLAPVSEQETLRPIMPTAGISDGQGLVIEAIVTFNLVLVALSVTTPGKHSTLASLTIGCCKGSGILAAGTHTGGLQNPIVPFGPAVATGNFARHFVVYWVGPYIGAIVAAVLYKVVMEINRRYTPKPVPLPESTKHYIDSDDVELNQMGRPNTT